MMDHQDLIRFGVPNFQTELTEPVLITTQVVF